MKLVLLVVSSLWLTKTPQSPLNEAEGRHRIEHAFQLLDQARHARQERQVAVLHLLSETSYTAPGKKQSTTTTTRVMLMSRGRHSYLATAEMQVFQDKQTQVCIVPAKHTILLTRTPSAEMTPWLKYSQELVAQARITSTTLVSTRQGIQRHIVAVPPATDQLAGKVAAIEYWLDSRTDAMQKMKMVYPATYKLHSAAIVFERQEWKEMDAAVDTPAISQVVGPDSQLRSAYRGFTLQDLRNSTGSQRR
jgi:hypothetical protein